MGLNFPNVLLRRKEVRLALICGFLLAFAHQAVKAQEADGISPCDSGCTDTIAACCANPSVCCTANDGCSKCGGCGLCFVWGENTFLKVGGGIRTSYNSIDNGNPNGGRQQDFSLNNARIYLSGQGHERIGFEFNTDINNAQGFDIHGVGGFGSLDEGEMRILDAILKLKLTDNVHLWMGRFLPPSDRSNLSGPFYLNAWNFPFVQFGYPNIFQGRDDGAALWGEYGGGVFKWQVGLFEGESAGGPRFIGQPATDNLMFAGRLVLNLLDPEPGYYNASTYYGEKDILAIGTSVMHRRDALADAVGAGQADFTGWNIDVLFERQLANCGVITLEAAYYDFNDNGGIIAGGGPVTLPPSGGPRQGESYFLLGSYLFPREFCLFNVTGQFQAMGRYQQYERDTVAAVAGGTDDQVDLQLNYIMFGHNTRISAVWSQLDSPGASNVDIFTLGTQVQF